VIAFRWIVGVLGAVFTAGAAELRPSWRLQFERLARPRTAPAALALARAAALVQRRGLGPRRSDNRPLEELRPSRTQRLEPAVPQRSHRGCRGRRATGSAHVLRCRPDCQHPPYFTAPVTRRPWQQAPAQPRKDEVPNARALTFDSQLSGRVTEDGDVYLLDLRFDAFEIPFRPSLRGRETRRPPADRRRNPKARGRCLR
jgi:hypothetical protein